MEVRVKITREPKMSKRCQLAEPSLQKSLLIHKSLSQAEHLLQGLLKALKSKKLVRPALKKDSTKCNQTPNLKTSKPFKIGKN
jgi:hypothetical protein